MQTRIKAFSHLVYTLLLTIVTVTGLYLSLEGTAWAGDVPQYVIDTVRHAKPDAVGTCKKQKVEYECVLYNIEMGLLFVLFDSKAVLEVFLVAPSGAVTVFFKHPSLLI